MTRPHLIAKLILAAVGVNLLMHSLGGIGSAVVMLSQKDLLPEAFAIRVFIIAAKSAITFAVSLILLFRSDGLVRIIAGPDADECAKVDERWTIAGLRMTACFCGLLILYRRIDLLFYYIPAFINGSGVFSYTILERQSSRISSTRALIIILAEIAEWILGIYLIFGAPHYVRRQIQAITIEQQPKNSGVDKDEQE
ncbi:MAG: hypothetical protein WBL85_00650 [Sedimentisphaerales bacterium]